MPFDPFDPQTQQLVRDAVSALGIRNLVLAIQDPSFPADPVDDLGRGTPYSRGAARLFELARALGFSGLQLGPQGKTSPDNPSPYDSTIFSRNPLDIAPLDLVDEGLLSPDSLNALVAARPRESLDRADYAFAWTASMRALDEAFDTATRQGWQRGPLERFGAENQIWLERDALYAPLCVEHGAGYWREWRTEDGEAHPDQRLFAPRPGDAAAMMERRIALTERYRSWIQRERFQQFWVARQHRALRERLGGFKLFGDLQIGFSVIDFWTHLGALLEHYRVGAPPSRTNPEGQPWGYQVLDPLQYGTVERPGPARRLLAERMDRMFGDYDGVRIDHPHGLVCPWVYRCDEADALRAVQHGARLFSSPDLPEHPELARYAIVRPEQLDRSIPRYADGRVRELDDEQLERYDALFGEVIRSCERNGRSRDDLLCEVLSTQPYPLQRVLARHGLGRFRVTQKADVRNPSDVYRSENARPEDWVMVGNHDTAPLWLVVERWEKAGALPDRAAYLAERLAPSELARSALAEQLSRSPQKLAQAQFADLFASPSRNVMIFFSDLLGIREVYNAPGTVGPENWSLRVPRNFEAEYRERAPEGRALNFPRALAMALRARELAPDLAAALDRVSE